MRNRAAAATLVAFLALGGLAACDEEDERDVEEIGNQIEKGVEDVGEDIEQEIDEADTDGKDD